MPTFKYEAMDTTGGEVKDSIEAVNEEEAQQKIRQMGYFVTKLTAVAGGGKGGQEEEEGRQEAARRSPSAASRSKMLVHLHPPVLDPPGRRPAGAAVACGSSNGR